MRSQFVAESRLGRCHASVRSGAMPCLRRGRVYTATRALGFDFGEAPEPERKSRKKMGNLNTVAASLLVTAPIMRGAVAEAFLACLAATQKLQASNKDVLASYSKFYGLLLSAGYDSWQDYLLDQLLMGRDNPVARAVAQGGLEDGAPVLRALAHDLDMLQVLAVGLPELAEYIGEMAPFASPDWVAAGSAAAFKRPTKQLRGGQPARVSALNMNTPSKFITRPPTADELTQWKDLIASKEEWSQALPAVKQYWHLHGFGITSRNTTLRWVKGALEEAPDSGPSTSTTPSASPTVASQYTNGPLTCLEEHSSNLAINTQRHCDGSPACLHVLVAGPSGSGKSWLLWENTLAAGRDRGVRLVDLNGADGATIVEAARGCGRYPRLRFILVADHVDLPFRGAGAAEFMAGLSNVGPGGWPSNTLLYCGATANSTVHMDPIVGRFGVTLVTKALTEEQFRTTIREMVLQRTGSEAPDAQVQHALEWAQGAYTIRSAAQYLSMN